MNLRCKRSIYLAPLAFGAQRPCGFGGGPQFFGNFFRLFGVEIQWQFNTAIRRNINADHTRIRGSDLDIRCNVALFVDAHGLRPFLPSSA
jgi:hypothetical protein